MQVSRALCAATVAMLLGACGGGGHHHHSMNAAFETTALVSDGTSAKVQDTKLVNAWGVAFNPDGFVWVANGGSASSTLYDGNGTKQALVVATPQKPTGIVYSGSSDFVVSAGGKSGPSRFIFATEGGLIAGWAPNVNLTSTVTAHDGSSGDRIYKGLAMGARGGAHFLYASDFHNGKVDVFDADFAAVTRSGAFEDGALPAGYAPFGIQAAGDRVYVAYARQDADAEDEIAGAGLGIVDVFDTRGSLVRRLVTGGVLNAPWGLALAPSDFGAFSDALLVGNFGDGKINGFDPDTGAWLGTLSRSDGTPIVIDGLWGLAFGNGLYDQPKTTLFFTAGPDDESHGAYGRIDVQ